jgi:hypothetical protein
MSTGLGSLARKVPVAVALPTLALLLYQLHLDWKVGSGRPDPAGAPGGTPSRARERILVTIILLLALFIYFLGFSVAIPLFVFVYAKRVEGQKSLPAAGIAMATGIVLTVVFGVFLDVMLYRGQLYQWLKLLPW